MMSSPPSPGSSRLDGLTPQTAQQVVAAAQALELGRPDEAAQRLAPVLSLYPEHPEALRLKAGILNLRGDYTGALAAMRRALELRPQDPLYYNTLGSILGSVGDFDGAIRALRHACELQPGLATAWYNLGVMLTRCVRHGESADALRRAVQLAPDHMDARALLADMLRVSGHVAEAAAEYRRILAVKPWTGMAWWGLADLRTTRFASGDVEEMRRALDHPAAGDDDRIATGFALARALEDDARYAESLDALKRAKELAGRRNAWNAPRFSAAVDDIAGAFAGSIAAAESPDLGKGAVFIVGLPRSGSTLVEQILASHSQVEGAGELPDLPLVLAEESRRHGKPFPQWAAAMRTSDWQRLGERYLERTTHWRMHRPFFTDKLPNNWIHVGAIRAMLPAAHVIVCRRDPLETCFSCYRQLLPGNEYTRRFDDLSAYWRDFDRITRSLPARHAEYVYSHVYEDLIADPERGIRALLDFCGLSFEEGCLRFHETRRDVRSPSATQVRQPLRSDTARAQRYGALLDPLRAALGLPLSETGA